jgi:hypothetical protein
MDERELLPAEAGRRIIGGVFDAEGVHVFEGRREAADFLFHDFSSFVVFCCFVCRLVMKRGGRRATACANGC